MIIGIDGNEANQENLVGIGQFALNVINQLEKIDKENEYWIYLKEPPKSHFPPERKKWKYIIFGPSKAWTQFALPLKLFTQSKKPDVFFSPSHYAPRFSPVPTVISIMDLWHHRHPEQFAKKDLYQLTSWEKYSVKNASRIVTISEFSKSEISEFYQYPKEKIKLAYPGINQYRVQSTEYKEDEVKKKYKIDGKYLLYLSTLQPKKNLSNLLIALSIIISQYPFPEGIPSILLVIAGKKGWLYEEIFTKVKELKLENNVIFTGFISEEDKPYLIKGAECFIMPSFYEGFGIPVVEAMALGVPVAISNVSSLPEVGGEAAFYFDPENPQEIAETIAKVLKLDSLKKSKVIETGKKQAQKFTWEKTAKNILQVLEEFKK